MATPPWNGQRFRFLIADEVSLYGVLPNGDLMWFPQWSTPQDAPRATVGQKIGNGWSDIEHIFAGGGGVIYTIDGAGDLRWYKDVDRKGSPGWAGGSGNIIGRGWTGLTHVFSGGGGHIYASTVIGQHLRWWRDLRQDGSNAPDGSTGWSSGSGAAIGQGWSGFRHILSGGGGVIYVIGADGALRWYRDDRMDGSNAADGSEGWAPNSGSVIGKGWRYATHVFAGGAGQIFACETMSPHGGYLRQYIDMRRDGVAAWRTIADMQIQWADATFSFGWQISPIEGYAWPLSVEPGQSVNFHVSTSRRDACVAEVVRLTGQDPALATPIVGTPVAMVPTEFQSQGDYGADCRWPVTFSFTPPGGVEAWESGFYAARVMGSSGPPYDIPFVIRRGLAPGRLALVVNVNTWQAYNSWGGADNYTKTAATIELTHKRPAPSLLTCSQDHLNGDANLRSEIWLMDWLRTRYSIDLLTDIDLHAGPDLSAYKAVLLSSHPEYWTQAMIAVIQGYLAGGGSLLYLGGNGMFRPTELLAETPGGDTDLLRLQSAQWPDYPLFEGKPLFAANVASVANPADGGVGYQIHAGAPFVPLNVLDGATAGAKGINPWWADDAVAVSERVPWGAAGLEVDVWPGPLPAGVAEIGRDPTSDAVIATYRTSAGGFVLGVGSVSFVGSLVVDPLLQAIVGNALADALAR